MAEKRRRKAHDMAPYTLLRIGLHKRSSTERSQRRIIVHGRLSAETLTGRASVTNLQKGAVALGTALTAMMANGMCMPRHMYSNVSSQSILATSGHRASCASGLSVHEARLFLKIGRVFCMFFEMQYRPSRIATSSAARFSIRRTHASCAKVRCATSVLGVRTKGAGVFVHLQAYRSGALQPACLLSNKAYVAHVPAAPNEHWTKEVRRPPLLADPIGTKGRRCGRRPTSDPYAKLPASVPPSGRGSRSCPL